MKWKIALVISFFITALTIASPSRPLDRGSDAFSGQVKPLTIDPASGQVRPLPIEEPKVKKIMAEGFAKIYGGNVENARLNALRMAYAEAVGRGSGTEINSFTLIRNCKDISNIISSRARGFIKEYHIFKEGISEKDPSRYEVVIEAVVIEEGKSLDEENLALKAYLQLLGNPRVLIILPEKRISTFTTDGLNSKDKEKEKTDVEYEKGDTKLKISQEKSKNSQQSGAPTPPEKEDRGETFRSTEAALAQAFARYGYQVITSDDLLAQGLCTPDVLAQAKAGVTARAVEVARAAGADLAFLGVLNLTQEIVKPTGVEFVMVTAEASAKALIVSSGLQLDVYHRAERASHSQMLMAYTECLDKIANNIVGTLAWKIPSILSDNMRETKLIINGINLAQAMDIKTALSKVEGVEIARITQTPTDKNATAAFILSTGFIFLEPAEVLEACAAAIKTPLKILDSNKYQLDFAVDKPGK